METNSSRPYRTRHLVRTLAATGLLGATAALTACGNGASATASASASDAAVKAAKIFASAGDYRPIEKSPGNLHAPVTTDELKNLKTQAAKSPDEYVQAASTTDLNKASTLLRDALSTPDLDARFKAVLGGEQGYVANHQASVEVVALYAELMNAQNTVSQLDAAVTRAVSLGNRLSLLEARKAGATKDIQSKIQEAQTKADDAKKAADEKQKAADDLKATLDDKRTKAQDLYRQAQKEQMAADQQKGDYKAKYKAATSRKELSQLVEQSLKADQAALETVKQGDALTDQIAQEQAHLDQATRDAAIAKVLADAAAADLKTLQSAGEAAAKQADEASKIIESLQAEKKAIVDELAKTSDRFYTGDLDGIDGHISRAVERAEFARKSFQDATSAQGQVVAAVSTLISDQKVNAQDPAVLAATDPTSGINLQYGQANADFIKAQAQLAGVSANELRDRVGKVLAQGYKALNMTGPAAPATASATGADRGADAVNSLKDAQNILIKVQNAARSGHFPGYGDNKDLLSGKFAINWAGPYLEYAVDLALAQRGVENAQDAADKAAKAAHDANPYLPLPASATSATPAPTTTPQ